ncbi:SMP-30/gluconolactonase/LRE family protein [Rhabdobacter roseus]|uniref:Gluconolactonase n=1 Tax=Rhabdobacter roseus TaxID=1655419 RepID=A0A840TW98_9BACT|nr:SMP-30/gluconolactonase/LRE family protein [Rhabdobacter roseus]MBB5287205.1 gluconolactonase [Rhabdobacter roseus]
MRKPILFFLPALLVLLLSGTRQEQPLVKEGATLQKLADGFAFTEGPISDAAGNVYFTDQPNNRILKWSTDGQLSTYLEPSGRANGMYIDHKGNLWVCADEKNELWLIDKNKNVKVLLKDYQGKLFNGPNDLWVRRDGGAYFTDPFYNRPYWQGRSNQPEQDAQAVYFLAKDHKTLKRVVDDLKQPNGIVGTPDGKTLYVADIGASKTYAYRINKDGSLSDRRLFCDMGSDGMTLDNRGNLYLTNRAGVTVFSPQGQQILNIPTGEGWTANVCFGGKNHQTLFITASKSFYSIDMNVKGVNP